MLRAGVGSVEITPPVGYPMGGYGGRAGVAQSVHDPLFARAMVLESDGSWAAFLVADLVALAPGVLAKVRSAVLTELGIAEASLVVAVTHTHSGPMPGKQAPDWEASLPDAMVAAARVAVESLQPARLGIGRSEATIGVNRRLKDPTGAVRLTPNPNGPVDPEVLVLRVDTAEGAPLGLLLNYSCHPVVLCEDSLQLSADFVGLALAQLESQTGARALFVNGACGDINPARRGDFATATQLATDLARAALDAYREATFLEDVRLTSAKSTLSLPTIPLPSTDALVQFLAVTRATLLQHRDPNNYEGRRLAEEARRAERLVAVSKARRERFPGLDPEAAVMTCPVQVLSVGGIPFFCTDQIFVALGQILKRGAQTDHAFVLGYVNESLGYLPTQAAFAEGGYEVGMAMLAPGGGEQLMEAFLAQWRSLNGSP